jgi:hypothetical protein
MTPATAITILAALYHESGRPSVEQGATLAHSLGQGRPFTEYSDISPEARQGRELTAKHLLMRLDFRATTSAPTEAAVERLAQTIHECEAPAIARGLVVVKLDPPREWIPFSALPEQAKTGRRNQARFLLSRFDVFPDSE